ncbi:hypothetical protein J2Z66_004088 [Paenibacillus eucommiae]|uniref:Transposase DDE domain-containing protein n=1 Tax=Paenibacillus eucommiae TaxID=1355755 RepID=A0ABS4IY14_9BACL|nr:hypothetical protein [Paenibacillus eucommiae]
MNDKGCPIVASAADETALRHFMSDGKGLITTLLTRLLTPLHKNIPRIWNLAGKPCNIK